MRVPFSGFQLTMGPLPRSLHVEHDGGVQEHGVVLGDHQVVHHHRRRQVDVHRVHQRAAGVGHVVAQVGLEERVGEEDHLAGSGIDPGVGGHRALQATVEVPLADGVQTVGHLGGHAALPQREPLAGVADDVGVGRVLHRAGGAGQLAVGEVQDVAEAGVDGAAQLVLALQATGPDPAVAVGHAVVGEADAVQHAVAVEHVVAGHGLERRIGAVADERPAEALGDLALDLAAGDVDLVADGEQVSG